MKEREEEGEEEEGGLQSTPPSFELANEKKNSSRRHIPVATKNASKKGEVSNQRHDLQSNQEGISMTTDMEHMQIKTFVRHFDWRVR